MDRPPRSRPGKQPGSHQGKGSPSRSRPEKVSRLRPGLRSTPETAGADAVKLYYRIGEVAQLVGVEPHVLRYWESEFRAIRPQKSRKGQRVYSRKDVDKLLRVKDLLYAQGYTIAGARKRLRDGGVEPPSAADPRQEALQRVHGELLAIRDELAGALADLGVPIPDRTDDDHGDQEQASAARPAPADPTLSAPAEAAGRPDEGDPTDEREP